MSTRLGTVTSFLVRLLIILTGLDLYQNVVSDKNGFEPEERGCGAFGEVGKIGGQFVDWMQGGEMNVKRLWESSACFTKPGARGKEVTF